MGKLPRESVDVIDEHHVERLRPDHLAELRQGRPLQDPLRCILVEELAALRDGAAQDLRALTN